MRGAPKVYRRTSAMRLAVMKSALRKASAPPRLWPTQWMRAGLRPRRNSRSSGANDFQVSLNPACTMWPPGPTCMPTLKSVSQSAPLAVPRVAISRSPANGPVPAATKPNPVRGLNINAPEVPEKRDDWPNNPSMPSGLVAALSLRTVSTESLRRR